jgi:hypothetical protein
VTSGFGWAAGHGRHQVFPAGARFDALNFIAWQMLVGVLPLTLLPFVFDPPATQWSVSYVLLLLLCRRSVDGARLPALDRGAALAAGRHRVAQHVRHSGDRAAVVDGDLRRAADEQRVGGIACIGAGLAIISADAWRAAAEARLWCRPCRRRSTAASDSRASGPPLSPICDCR